MYLVVMLLCLIMGYVIMPIYGLTAIERDRV
jgi:hypothetical protein